LGLTLSAIQEVTQTLKDRNRLSDDVTFANVQCGQRGSQGFGAARAKFRE
jgi:hypothetical protein